MFNETNRIKSFSKWPHGADFIAKSTTLAKCGFYHDPTEGFPDRCVCFSCGVPLAKWARSCDPRTEHMRQWPNCPFIKGEYGRFLQESARLSSFTNKWPHPPSFRPTPRTLARAGFYYCPTKEHNDRCVCFCCGLVLISWESKDDPWTEHAQHTPFCPFVHDKPTENIPLNNSPAKMQLMLKQLEELNIDLKEDSSTGTSKGYIYVIPSQFVCPITRDIMTDPVVADDGHSYDRAAITQWLNLHNTSPLTNSPLRTKSLIPNLNLRAQLFEFVEQIINNVKSRKIESPNDEFYTVEGTNMQLNSLTQALQSLIEEEQITNVDVLPRIKAILSTLQCFRWPAAVLQQNQTIVNLLPVFENHEDQSISKMSKDLLKRYDPFLRSANDTIL